MGRRAKEDCWKHAVRLGLVLTFVVLFGLMYLLSGVVDSFADKLASGICGYDRLDKYEYLSSFVEVMIALNVASLFDGVRKYFDKKQSMFVTAQVKEVCKDKKGSVKESAAREVERTVKPILKYTRKNAQCIARWAKILGVIVSMVLALSLMTNIPKELRSYVFMAAFPVAMLYVVGSANNGFCKLRLRYACLHIVVDEDPIDDERVIESIGDASGPRDEK